MMRRLDWINLAAVLFGSVAVAAQASAEALPLPSCQEPADGSTVVVYDIHQNRYISALRTPATGDRTTLLLDCRAGRGYEIMDDGSNPSVIHEDGSWSFPAFATDILDNAFASEQAYSFSDLAGMAAEAGFDVEPLALLPACACTEEMLHAFD